MEAECLTSTGLHNVFLKTIVAPKCLILPLLLFIFSKEGNLAEERPAKRDATNATHTVLFVTRGNLSRSPPRRLLKDVRGRGRFVQQCLILGGRCDGFKISPRSDQPQENIPHCSESASFFYVRQQGKYMGSPVRSRSAAPKFPRNAFCGKACPTLQREAFSI